MKVHALKSFFGYNEEDELEDETFIDKIKYKYWKIIPYDWRPHQLWYRLKCWAWYRYTTIKPRYLDHTWCDKTELILHINFEMLMRFVENEVLPGPVDWGSDKEHRDAYIEMMDLYNWYKGCMEHPDKYRSLLDLDFNELDDVLHKKIRDEEHKPFDWIPEKNKEGKVKWYIMESYIINEQKYRDYVRAMAKLESLHEQFLENQLIRLIKLRHWLWT